MNELCDVLPWDSEFFGVRIARVVAGTLDADGVRHVEAWCRRHDIDCLYFLADDQTREERAVLETSGFRPVDSRVTLEAAAGMSGDDFGMRLATNADVAALRTIAEASHRGTRFYSDARFAPSASRLYGYWIEKSVADPDITVFVPEGPTVLGYITCYVPESGSGQIGLLGVAEAARGQGAGKRLVRMALSWCAAHAAPRVRVVTQAGNQAALSVYTACGFAPVRTQWWYHRWFTDRSAA